MFSPSSTGRPQNEENQNLEIDDLGVLGRPEHRTPVEEKIQKAIFRGLRNTGTPNTGWGKKTKKVGKISGVQFLFQSKIPDPGSHQKTAFFQRFSIKKLVFGGRPEIPDLGSHRKIVF